MKRYLLVFITILPFLVITQAQEKDDIWASFRFLEGKWTDEKPRVSKITQVYEFSRIYWKGLKQRSQPVTTEYSKLIADFSSKFGGEIPENTVAQTTPWFI